VALQPNDAFHLRTGVTAHQRIHPESPAGVGTLGMKIFIASLSFVFAATVLLYVILLGGEDAPEVRLLPIVGIGLVVSTVLIVWSSFTLRRGTRAIAAGDAKGLVHWLRRTLWLGTAFGVVQVVNWVLLWTKGIALDADHRESGFFIVLTVLHALHVTGGFVRLVQIERRAARGEFTSADREPVATFAMYWHFLDVVWVLLVLAIVVVSL
jgi:cytochrome c oxidase subunit III